MKYAELSSFISYDLDSTEQVAAYTYSELQRAGIQNMIAAAAEEFVRLGVDITDMDIESSRRRAYLKGQIEFGKYLLSMHDTMSDLQAEARDQSNLQGE